MCHVFFSVVSILFFFSKNEINDIITENILSICLHEIRNIQAPKYNFVGHIKDILPIDQDDWSKVKIRHDLGFRGFNRMVDSFERKFRMLDWINFPTGDPEMPVEVCIAKRTFHKIGKKADIGDGTENRTVDSFNRKFRMPHRMKV